MMSDSEQDRYHSKTVDAAAVRWAELNPDEEDVGHPAPLVVPEIDEHVPNRHSASAEAASLRWHESQPDDE